MTLNELMDMSNVGIGDDLLAGYWDFKNERPFYAFDGTYILTPEDGRADGLVRFLMIEIMETYDPMATDQEQVTEAKRVVRQAASHCKKLADHLYMNANA